MTGSYINAFLPDEKLHELAFGNGAVPVLVHLAEQVLDFLVVQVALQEGGHLLEGNLAAVVDVEVGEGLLEVLLGDLGVEVDGGHQELGVVDIPRAVGVHEVDDLLDLLLVQLHETLLLQGLFYFFGVNDPVLVAVDRAEQPQQLGPLLARQQL